MEKYNDTVLSDKEIESVQADNQNILDNISAGVSSEDLDRAKESKDIDNNNSEMEAVPMNLIINPATGEHKIIGGIDEPYIPSFDTITERVPTIDDIGDVRLASQEDIIDYIANNDGTILEELANEVNVSEDTIRELLDIVNRRMSREDFNIYKAAPDEVKELVDNYIARGGQLMNIPDVRSLNSARNYIATSLIDDFINNIKRDRAKSDFAIELENIYNMNDESEEPRDFDERNKSFRNMTDEIEDPVKKDRLKKILDQIDEARSLSGLKEFAKTCKIKRIELEKPDTRVYRQFLNKYADTYNNIYHIDIAYDVLVRYMERYNCSPIDVTAFLVCFCKQVRNYDPNNILDHAYMYYVLYYCIMMDSDKTTTFTNNVYDVISTLKSHNKV